MSLHQRHSVTTSTGEDRTWYMEHAMVEGNMGGGGGKQKESIEQGRVPKTPSWVAQKWQRMRIWVEDWLSRGNVYETEDRFWWRVVLRVRKLSNQYRRRFAMIMLGFICVLLILFWSTANEDSQFQDSGRLVKPHFARSDDPGVDFTAISRNLTCGEQQTGLIANGTVSLSQLMHHSELALKGEISPDIPPLPCTCAPLFGIPVRLLSIRLPDEQSTIIHAHRPWLEVIPGDQQIIVTENQDFLWPPDQGKGSVKVKRWPNIIVHYTNRQSCHEEIPLQLNSQYAYCAQACDELMRGTTVDKSPNALPKFVK